MKNAILLCIVAILTAAPVDSDDRMQATPIRKPLLVLTGAKSAVMKAAYHRLESADQLKMTWRAHIGPEYDHGDLPVPEVDFDHCSVVALFQGSSFNSRGLQIVEVQEKDDATVLRFDDVSYQTNGAANAVTPYAFAVLPKTDKPIVIEENQQPYLGEPPVWKEVARLNAAKR